MSIIIAITIIILIGFLDMYGIIILPGTGSFLTPLLALSGASTVFSPSFKKSRATNILGASCTVIFIIGSIFMFVEINDILNGILMMCSGTLMFVIAIIERYQRKKYKQKYKKMPLWRFVLAMTLLVMNLLIVVVLLYLLGVWDETTINIGLAVVSGIIFMLVVGAIFWALFFRGRKDEEN